MSDKQRALAVVSILSPVMATVIVMPAALALTFHLPSRFDGFVLLLVLPFWLGLAAAPGYFRSALLIFDSGQAVPRWCTASIFAALLAAGAGVFAGIPLILPSVLSLVTVACCVAMLVQQRRLTRRTTPAP